MSNNTEEMELRSARTRTLDQVKRLYAVVMGFAANECVRGIILSIRSSDNTTMASWIFISFGTCFISLMILFYLGTERYLDRRYLGKKPIDATWNGMAFDILTLIVSATWFVILSHSLPVDKISSVNPIIRMSNFSVSHSDFVKNLLVLYIIDIGILIIQLIRLNRTLKSSGDFSDNEKAYKIWIAINFGCVVFTLIVICNNIFVISGVFLAIVMTMMHILRFVADFSSTFNSYYPSGKSKDKGVP